MHGRILIVDDVATNRIIYKVKLTDAFYEPLMAADGETCLQIARAERPDLILLDLMLPDMPGTEVVKALRSDPATRSIPIIVLTAARDGDARQQALSVGADDVMSKPVRDDVLMARVRNLLRSRNELGLVTSAWGMPAHSVLGLAEQTVSFDPVGTIAVITSRPETGLRLKHELQRTMRDRILILTREQALAVAMPGEGEVTDVPEVFVIEADLDGTGGGLRLMSELNSRSTSRHSTFCILSPVEDGDGVAMAFDLGAHDVIAQSLTDRELALRLRILMRRKRQGDRQRATLEDGLRLAVIDPLTGIYNRRYAMPRLAGIAAQAESETSNFAVMVVDLDRFKAVNDRYGHAAGDQVLIQVAKRLSENLRMADLLARIGGEEFLVALPQTSFAEAQRVAERLCAVVAEHPIRLPSGQSLTVTVSIGVAVGTAGGARPNDVAAMVDRADRALMQSKTDGRNKVTFFQSAA